MASTVASARTLAPVAKVPTSRLAEKPELAEQIRTYAAEDESDTRNITQRVDLLGVARAGEGKQALRDELPVYYFFHAPTPAMPPSFWAARGIDVAT